MDKVEDKLIKNETGFDIYGELNEEIGSEVELTRKQIRKESRDGIAKAVRSVKKCDTYMEALAIKDNLLQQGIMPNNRLYYELIYKCSNFEIIKEIVQEMKNNNYKLDEKTYSLIINKCDRYEQALELATDMGREGIFPSVKLYYLLIKKSECQEDILFFDEKLKEFHLILDSGIVSIMASKLHGNESYYKFAHLKYVLKSIEELVPKIHSMESALQVIQRLKDLDINLDIELFNLILGKANSIEAIEIIIHIIKNYNTTANVETYMYLLKKSIELQCLNRFNFELEEIEATLDYYQHDNLIKAFKASSSLTGGMGKYLIEKEKIINSLKADAKAKNNFLEKTYLLGVITGLEDGGKKSYSIKQATLQLLGEFKKEEDYELYEYDIKNTEGILDGIDKAQKLYETIQAKQIPLKIIAFVSNAEILNRLSYFATSRFFYKTSLDNINRYEVNSFNLTDSIDEFYEIIKKVDYDKYDVSVTIVSEFESKDFLEYYHNASSAIEYLNEVLIDKVCNVRYIKISDKPYASVENIFTRMYKDYSMSCSKRLV